MSLEVYPENPLLMTSHLRQYLLASLDPHPPWRLNDLWVSESPSSSSLGQRRSEAEFEGGEKAHLQTRTVTPTRARLCKRP